MNGTGVETIVLIGPPGAGKSTVGHLLAQRLGVGFTDTDQAIEERVGRTIAEIFVDDGEPAFREIEERVVLEALQNESGVISLGGGSILSEPVRNHLRSKPDSMRVVFLDVSISHAAPRVGFNRERPLLLVNPRAQWQELMNRRRPFYLELADHVLDTNDLSPVDIAEQIVTLVSA